MIEVILEGHSSGVISDIVRELKSQGFVVGQDFDFWYTPGGYDWQSLETTARHTRFRFYSDSVATWFALKYQ
jgi:hypothetical protein